MDGAEIIADLDRKIHLTEQQREDLVRVLRQVATMQARIDRHENPSEREEMQRKLIRQLAVRLRLIVGEESSKGVTRALVKNKPRIVYK